MKITFCRSISDLRIHLQKLIHFSCGHPWALSNGDLSNLHGFNLEPNFIALYAVEEGELNFWTLLGTNIWLQESKFNSGWSLSVAAFSFEVWFFFIFEAEPLCPEILNHPAEVVLLVFFCPSSIDVMLKNNSCHNSWRLGRWLQDDPIILFFWKNSYILDLEFETNSE